MSRTPASRPQARVPTPTLHVLTGVVLTEAGFGRTQWTGVAVIGYANIRQTNRCGSRCISAARRPGNYSFQHAGNGATAQRRSLARSDRIRSLRRRPRPPQKAGHSR